MPRSTPQQRAAVLHRGDAPLLVIAGAGHRQDDDARAPDRAARDRRRRPAPHPAADVLAPRIAGDDPARAARRAAVPTCRGPGRSTRSAAGCLRMHALALGLDPAFTVLDRGDAADLIDLVRVDRGLAKGERRFPKKDTCLAIYSRTVNARVAARDGARRGVSVVSRARGRAARAVRRVRRGEARASRARLRRPAAVVVARDEPRPRSRRRSASRFDHVLVDEYQDTNALQAEIVVGAGADRPRRHRGRRRRAGDLLVPRRDACTTSSTFPTRVHDARRARRRSRTTTARPCRSSPRRTR